jgi:hypothetical protein
VTKKAPKKSNSPAAGRKKPANRVPTKKQLAALKKGAPAKGSPSRNPAGRPKSADTIISQARAIVDSKSKTGAMPDKPPADATIAYFVARTWVGQAVAGDKDARKELHDRLYGKVQDEVLVKKERTLSDAEALKVMGGLDAERDLLLGKIKDLSE